MSEQNYEAAHDKYVKRWLEKLNLEEKEHKDYRKEAKEAIETAQRTGEAGKKVKFPIYTANNSIQHAALFSKLPDADVRRPHQNQGDKEAAQAALKAAQPELHRGVSKGVMHRNTVARKLSRLSGRINAL